MSCFSVALFVDTYSEACKINIKPITGTISHSLEILKRKTIHAMNAALIWVDL
jgi:hypothetical protein